MSLQVDQCCAQKTNPVDSVCDYVAPSGHCGIEMSQAGLGLPHDPGHSIRKNNKLNIMAASVKTWKQVCVCLCLNFVWVLEPQRPDKAIG